MDSRSKNRGLATGFALTLLMASVACITPTGKPSSTAKNPECPHDWTQRVVYQDLAGVRIEPGNGSILNARQDSQPLRLVAVVEANPDVPAGGFAVPGATTNVPEFHDCQKLRVVDASGAAAYGPLAGLFAKAGLGSLADADFVTPQVVGLVYLPYSGRYDPLKINTRFSCLVVQITAGTPQAWLVGVNGESQCDVDGSALGLNTTNALAVRFADLGGAVEADIPAVARWDWDASANQHYIGTRCGPHWCEIGATGFTASAIYSTAGMTDPNAVRNLKVKGWYDEQYLAENEVGDAVPSNNLGTVVPAPGLDAFHRGETPTGKWAEVATVHITPSAASYRASFNFVAATAVPPAGEKVTLSLCYGTWRTCRPASKRWFTPWSCDADLSQPGVTRKWYARVRGDTGPTKYYCTIFRHHEGDFTIPAVTRWRWRRNDETIWVSCPTGCCEVNAGDG